MLAKLPAAELSMSGTAIMRVARASPLIARRRISGVASMSLQARLNGNAECSDKSFPKTFLLSHDRRRRRKRYGSNLDLSLQGMFVLLYVTSTVSTALHFRFYFADDYCPTPVTNTVLSSIDMGSG